MHTSPTKKVAKNNIRNYAYSIANHWLGRKVKMSKQAKTLTPQELRRVLDYIATRKHAARNRAVLLIMYYAGLRVGEAASLRVEDVVDAQGHVRAEFLLRADQTKGRHARTVFVSERLRKELTAYLAATPSLKPKHKLFYSQKVGSDGFSANTLAQHFHYLYKRAEIVGASSHSTRRTFITNLAAHGVGVRVIMGLSGHRALSSVQCYIDCNDDQKRKAIELV
jgi:integrase/recombinase XerD